MACKRQRSVTRFRKVAPTTSLVTLKPDLTDGVGRNVLVGSCKERALAFELGKELRAGVAEPPSSLTTLEDPTLITALHMGSGIWGWTTSVCVGDVAEVALLAVSPLAKIALTHIFEGLTMQPL